MPARDRRAARLKSVALQDGSRRRRDRAARRDSRQDRTRGERAVRVVEDESGELVLERRQIGSRRIQSRRIRRRERRLRRFRRSRVRIQRGIARRPRSQKKNAPKKKRGARKYRNGASFRSRRFCISGEKTPLFEQNYLARTFSAKGAAPAFLKFRSGRKTVNQIIPLSHRDIF